MSGLNLTLQAGVAPFGTQLPGTAQDLIDFIAEYELINGTSNFNGINFGASTPSPENRGLPWFKTDQFGNPLGLFSWNGLVWAPIPIVTASGTFANAPMNPGLGTQYLATDLGCMIMWVAQGWTTVGGTPGDYKFVETTSIGLALQNNPGWAQASNQTGCTLAAAGAATGISVAHPQGQLIGEEAHTIQISELPSHTHAQTVGLSGVQADGNTGNPAGVIPDRNPTVTGPTGGGSPANVIQPTYYTFLLVKQF